MLIAKPATVDASLKSRFLTGFSPLELQVILAAARQRHFASNSVVVDQGGPLVTYFY
jgi:hypothetical protein